LLLWPRQLGPEQLSSQQQVVATYSQTEEAQVLAGSGRAEEARRPPLWLHFHEKGTPLTFAYTFPVLG
jgi:hypothetical protein